MDATSEQKVLSTLYDRLFDAISYSPDGRPSGFDRQNSRLLMAKNVVLDPSDFANAFSPVNSGPAADQKAARAFSDMVDVLPVDQVEWADSTKRLSGVYEGLVAQANTTNVENPDQRHTYDLAYGYLNATTSTPPDMFGKSVQMTGPTAIAQTYNDDQTAYINAVGGYRAAFNGYNLDVVADQRAWMAVEPGLRNTVDQAWNRWNREGKAQVEQAQQALQSSINDAVSAAITQARQLVSPGAHIPSLDGVGEGWLLSYAQPRDWASPSITASKLTLQSSYLNETASSEASSYSAGGSGGWGLWSASASMSHSSSESHSHMDASEFELTAELIQVRIMRPWFNPLLLSMQGWWVDGTPEGGLATMMPLVPTAFILARNVTIKADFSEQDKSHIESATSGSASVGWGPFGASGSYSSSSSADTFTSKFDGGTLQLPGLQLIGWVNTVTPAGVPPMAAPAAAAGAAARSVRA
ncbi:MAG TPA: hypothetical protein VFJ16_20300 [Longimicrobium sp.]|nr:hypothetical protein [Longimicrobium sp.]